MSTHWYMARSAALREAGMADATAVHGLPEAGMGSTPFRIRFMNLVQEAHAIL